MTSGIVSCSLLLLIASAFFSHPGEVPASAAPGTITWDPCRMTVEYGSMHQLMGLITFGALILFTAQGFRNQPGPRWLAISSILALILVLQGNMQTSCYTGTTRLLSAVWVGSVVLLFAHHASQPRVRNDLEAPNRRSLMLASQVISGVFILVVGLWFAFFQAMEMLAHGQPRLVEAVVSDVQRRIRVPAYLLLPFAGAVAVYQIKTRSKAWNRWEP